MGCKFNKTIAFRLASNFISNDFDGKNLLLKIKKTGFIGYLENYLKTEQNYSRMADIILKGTLKKSKKKNCKKNNTAQNKIQTCQP